MGILLKCVGYMEISNTHKASKKYGERHSSTGDKINGFMISSLINKYYNLKVLSIGFYLLRQGLLT